jgi:peptide-methionine (S)-S-oxide reductase
VSAGGTGHCEAVHVVYDPEEVSFGFLVSEFFRTIDPFDADGQFCDRGEQYRAAVFVAEQEEIAVAEAVKAAVETELGKRVATEIQALAPFYAAEWHHQDYYKKNPIRYRFYRLSCGRDARLRRIWGGSKREQAAKEALHGADG